MENSQIDLSTYLKTQDISTGLIQTILAIGDAGKDIRSFVLVAGLNNQFGSTNTINIQGEKTQKLDIVANNILKKTLFSCTHVGVIASEEEETIAEPSDSQPLSSERYAVLIDPLDGSSNIDVNVSIGTIFSIYEMADHSPINACLQPGNQQIAAGYILFGTSTVLILTLRNRAVLGFTYDPKKDQFLLSHPTIKTPDQTRYYSVNEGNKSQLMPESIRFIDHAKCNGLSTRYIGSLVADFHRNLLKGGIYLYPKLKNKPDGKLRLLYEANPLALICQNAGGKASDGFQNILDITPKRLHQRTPLFIGNASLVDQIYTETITH
mgnify:CR=1 FL=1